MTGNFYTAEKIRNDLEVPDVFLPLIMAHTRLLPGETRDSFFSLFDIMVGAILPETDMEWLMTIDLSWLQFEIQRYRRWKGSIIMSNRTGAIETALCNSHPGAAVPGTRAAIVAEARTQAQQMSQDPNAHPALRARLESHGYDADAINAGAFVESMVPLVTIEKLLSTARREVALIMREVGLHREFKRRAALAMKQIESDPKEPN